MFEKIKHFDDVKQYIDENFIVKDTEFYKCISYILPNNKTFPELDTVEGRIRQEFRGIIFCNKTGKILRRPFQKFFNYGEKVSLTFENLKKYQEALITTKLDGSMVVPFITHDGKLIMGTKMGETDLSPIIQQFIDKNPNYDKFIRQMIVQGKTPIFEYLDSVNNKIVLDYGTEVRLVLLTIRDMITGEYEPFGFVQHLAHLSNIECVQKVTDRAFDEEFVEYARKRDGEEGYVVKFTDGQMCKIKNEWYTLVHGAKSSLSGERNVIQLILNGKSDDLKPLLEKENRISLEIFEEQVLETISKTVLEITKILYMIDEKQIDRKTFALEYLKGINEFYRGFIWSNWGKEISFEKISTDVIQQILKYSGMSKRKYEQNVRSPLLDTYKVIKWRPFMFFESGEENDNEAA